MAKPTPDELATALKHAAVMREQGEDYFHVAKALLNLNYRLRYLEHVLERVKIYLNSGEAAVEHTALIKAIEAAELAAMAPGEEDDRMHPW
jgi:hypothetical protein